LTCLEARQLIPAWVDQELSARDVAALERHMKVCADCAAEGARHRSFVKGLRESLPRTSIPADVKARVMAGLSPQASPARPEPQNFSWRWMRSGALAAALSMVLALVLMRPQGAPDVWTQFYRDDHQAHSQGPAQLQIRSASAPAVSAWLSQSVGHPVHVPMMKDAKLLGGRLSVLRGQALASVVYRSDGKPLSLFVGDPKLLCPPSLSLAPDQLFASAGAPYSVVAWEHHGHFHVLVAELGLNQLKELARQCQVSAI
jgi:anti-sigma factor RsiW